MRCENPSPGGPPRTIPPPGARPRRRRTTVKAVGRVEKTPEADELTALMEVLLCDAELETRIARLEAAMAPLQPASSREDLPEDFPPDPRARLFEAVGCLLDHLRPAREVMRRFEEALPLGEPEPEVRAEEGIPGVEAPGHRRFRDFLAGVEAGELPAIRHLLTCPLCKKMARVVLFGFLPT